ncbi:RNA-directed DNA polymerase, eukaryota, reverse transcriptase zinc-binding domain protein [Tanacetum coccineum]|uniref:RNA-directed DNA polymerase, eukaryota, reverse transcriptase zinc-binding domain protein n=1 Tax=Tanacetum coccineum TaxID=301880 RepID=A0ABQ5G501_9ASTR
MNPIIFWHDRWLDEGPCLKIRFPRLNALDENTNFRLNERLAEIDGSCVLSSAWRSSPRGRSCNKLNSLYSITESRSLNSGALDGWKWTLGSGKDFTAKTLSVMVDSILLEPYHYEQKFKWNSWVPRKINIFAWRVFNDRLSLFVNLDNRGLDVGSVLCPFCSNAPEDANHLLTCCPRVLTIWRKVFSWWKMDFPSNLSLSLLASSAAHLPHNKAVVKVFQGVCLIALWCIWYWRNRLVHEVAENRASILSEDCFSKIQSLSLLWMSSRCPKKNIFWDNWILMPDVVGIG